MIFSARHLMIASMVCLLAAPLVAQQETPETNRKIEGGGISVKGWEGKVDADAEKAGQSAKDAKLSEEGKVLHVTTGPAMSSRRRPEDAAKGLGSLVCTGGGALDVEGHVGGDLVPQKPGGVGRGHSVPVQCRRNAVPKLVQSDSGQICFGQE